MHALKQVCPCTPAWMEFAIRTWCLPGFCTMIMASLQLLCSLMLIHDVLVYVSITFRCRPPGTIVASGHARANGK